MKKTLSFILISILISALFTGCRQSKQPVTKTGVYFDTVISITLYEKNSSELIDECFKIADKYENLFSKTLPDSDISRINNSNDYVKVDKETIELIEKSFKYEDLSDGKFSVVCGALTDLWDIPNEIIPSESEINYAINLCGKDKLDINSESCQIRINTNGAKLDLGAVAKGYIADKMKEYLLLRGVEYGIIELGGNVLTIGNNPLKDDGLYHIGIAKPFSKDGEVITAVAIQDSSVVTSGNYQRYFKKDEKIYHHIIDLKTGYPANTGLNSATVVCQSSTEADIMSTILFLCGNEKGASLADSLNITKVVFINNNNELLE